MKILVHDARERVDGTAVEVHREFYRLCLLRVGDRGTDESLVPTRQYSACMRIRRIIHHPL